MNEQNAGNFMPKLPEEPPATASTGGGANLADPKAEEPSATASTGSANLAAPRLRSSLTL